MKLQDTFNQIIKEVAAQFVERDNEVMQLALCLLAEQHAVLLGEPGIAKSKLLAAIVSRFVGARLWKKLLRRDSTCDETFGPLSLKGLEADEYRRVTFGTLAEAEIGCGEEVFKCNSTVLNGILDIINERTFENGPTTIKCPLISFIATSNEEPQSDDLNAFYDRLLVRIVVRDIQEDAAFADFLDLLDANPSPANFAFSSLDDLKDAHKEVRGVTIGADAKTAIIQLRKKLHKAGIRPSPRRIAACVAYLRAVAWLEGRSQIEVDDLMALGNCLWVKQDQISEVNRILGETASPELGTIIELLDAAKEVFDAAKESTDAPTQLEANTKLRGTKKKLNDMAKVASSGKVKARAEKAAADVKGWHNRLLEKLGMSAL